MPYGPVACIYIFILVPIQGQHALWSPQQEGSYGNRIRSMNPHHNPGLHQESSNGSMQNLPRASVLQANANATYQRLPQVNNNKYSIIKTSTFRKSYLVLLKILIHFHV